MIQVNGLTKRFGDFPAISGLDCTIPEGCVYGLVGANGAGKSTLLRLICGIYRPDKGNVTLDGKNIYENPALKSRLAFVPDELYFLPQSSLARMKKAYAAVYPRFDPARYAELLQVFHLEENANLNTFSKGMRRQAAMVLALSCRADFLFLDETFDGLDPILRNLVKKLLYADVAERGCTAVLTSHSLRELEDTCDQLALLHKGGLVLESDVQKLKTTLFKVQIAFDHAYDHTVFSGFDVLNFTRHGSVSNLIVRGDREAVTQALRTKSPVLLEVLPLSLEEVFLYEMESLGYAFDDEIR